MRARAFARRIAGLAPREYRGERAQGQGQSSEEELQLDHQRGGGQWPARVGQGAGSHKRAKWHAGAGEVASQGRAHRREAPPRVR
eukprot:12569663-Alexandrium_andersonii.AAC.1